MADWMKGEVPHVKPSKVKFEAAVPKPKIPAGPQRLHRLYSMWIDGLNDNLKLALRDWLFPSVFIMRWCSIVFCWYGFKYHFVWYVVRMRWKRGNQIKWSKIYIVKLKYWSTVMPCGVGMVLFLFAYTHTHVLIMIDVGHWLGSAPNAHQRSLWAPSVRALTVWLWSWRRSWILQRKCWTSFQDKGLLCSTAFVVRKNATKETLSGTCFLPWGLCTMMLWRVLEPKLAMWVQAFRVPASKSQFVLCWEVMFVILRALGFWWLGLASIDFLILELFQGMLYYFTIPGSSRFQ